MDEKIHNPILFGFIIFLLFYLYFWLVSFNFNLPSGSGEFGDMFGALNAFLSSFAIIGLIYTVYLQTRQISMQKEELSLQRRELKLTREELAKTAEAQEISSEALRKQAASMRLSAKLQGLSALLTFTISQNKNSNSFNYGAFVNRMTNEFGQDLSPEDIAIEIKEITDAK